MDQDLYTRATEITDEEQEGANTAQRVGSLFTDTLKVAEGNEKSISTVKSSLKDINSTLEAAAKSISSIETRTYELGNFATEEAALSKLASADIAGNIAIITAHCTYQGGNSITLQQSIVGNYCRQVIFNKDKYYHRAITFQDSTRATVTQVEDWAPLFADRLVWDTDANKYVPSQFGLTFNKGYTDAIPTATAENDGLMSKHRYQQTDTNTAAIVSLKDTQTTQGATLEKNTKSIAHNAEDIEHLDARVENNETQISSLNTKAKSWDRISDLVSDEDTGLNAAWDDINLNSDSISKNYDEIQNLKKGFRELGNFETKDLALAKLASVDIAGNIAIITAHCTYQGGISITMQQSIVNDYCRQLICENDHVQQRGIYFQDGTRATVTRVENLAPLFADRLVWDTDTNKYVPSQFGLTFNQGYTDAIPTATAENDGLMSKHRYQQTDTNTAAIASLKDTQTTQGSTLATATQNITDLKATTEAAAKSISNIETRTYELGNFASEDAALSKLASADIAGNIAIITAHCTYQGGNSITLHQSIVGNYCRQVIFNKDKYYHRAITFQDSTRATVTQVEDWTPLFADRLVWDTDANKYVPSQFGLTFNKDYTEAIPTATTENDGLMSKHRYQQTDTNTAAIAANKKDITAINSRCVELGTFDSEEAVISNLGELSICANGDIVVAHASYKADGTTYTITMLQCLSYNYCRQIIFNRDKIKQRGITFTSGQRTAIKKTEYQEFLFGDRLKWDSTTNKYVLNQFGSDFNRQQCDAIPTATTEHDGLMSRTQYSSLEATKEKADKAKPRKQEGTIVARRAIPPHPRINTTYVFDNGVIYSFPEKYFTDGGTLTVGKDYMILEETGCFNILRGTTTITKDNYASFERDGGIRLKLASTEGKPCIVRIEEDNKLSIEHTTIETSSEMFEAGQWAINSKWDMVLGKIRRRVTSLPDLSGQYTAAEFEKLKLNFRFLVKKRAYIRVYNSDSDEWVLKRKGKQWRYCKNMRNTCLVKITKGKRSNGETYSCVGNGSLYRLRRLAERV